MILVRPSCEHLSDYVDALNRGWSPGPDTAHEILQKIEASADDYLLRYDDPQALAEPVRLPDGSVLPRLPGLGRWIWDGAFCGMIGLRWQNGTAQLPAWCLGHIGYSVVPWKRRRGYATAALAKMLPEARERGLPYVEIVTDVDNVASQRVMIANGAVLVERFEKLPQYGGGPALRFRIEL